MKIAILDYDTEEVLILPYDDEFHVSGTIAKLQEEQRISHNYECMVFSGKITIE